MASSDAPHLPRSAPIEAYGKGGFAFADMSHRGSLLCLPEAIWAWPVARPEEIDQASQRYAMEIARGMDWARRALDRLDAGDLQPRLG